LGVVDIFISCSVNVDVVVEEHLARKFRSKKFNGNKKTHLQLERIKALMIRRAKGLERMNFFYIAL